MNHAMAKSMLRADRLSALLAPQGFWLQYANTVTKDIRFVRRSTIPRLYEQLHVSGQGKSGEAVYATTCISAGMVSYDECMADRDHSLMFALETDVERHWTLLRNDADAQAWERKLTSLADSYCRATAEEKGPALHDRLLPELLIVDRYVAKLGDINDIFSSEFQYVSNAPVGARHDAQQLAALIGNIGEETEDIELACLTIFSFWYEIEGRTRPFHGQKWHQCNALRIRIYLLVDFIRQQRRLYRGEMPRK